MCWQGWGVVGAGRDDDSIDVMGTAALFPKLAVSMHEEDAHRSPAAAQQAGRLHSNESVSHVSTAGAHQAAILL